MYDEMYNSGFFILPNRETLRRLTTGLGVKEGLEVGPIKYLQLRVNKLNPRERLVNLAMYEVLS